ncbi:MAG: hypothetical protein IPP13_08320 [Kouleothrix sp.]|jgi:hypothetical protein|nr:hypothetical protein [Kouleothrix sp.]
MQWLSTLADIVGIASATFALRAWLKARQLRAKLLDRLFACTQGYSRDAWE